MLCLKNFLFPDDDTETDFLWSAGSNSCYPFRVLSARGLARIDFEPVTILYGGNGSGKSTALNVIAEKTGIKRDSAYNKSSFFPAYVDMCGLPPFSVIPGNSRILTSDDVFDYMLNVRALNEGVDSKREELKKEYLDAKYAGFQFRSFDDYEQLKKSNKAKSKTQSKFVKSELANNIREFSNGESAYKYFTAKIGENGFYLLDEPENSLSPKRQLELTGFIEDSVRFFGCQFVIATHSPFLLALRDAKIYDLDENPARIKQWTELENVRVYYDFFKKHDGKFQAPPSESKT